MKNKLGILEIKAALHDDRFRALFPEYEKEFKEFFDNPGCACNITLYRKLLVHKDRLQKYFPTKEIETPEEELNRLSSNRWKVINCKRSQLENELRKLPKGRKYISVAIWQDEVTVVVNEIDLF